MIESYEEAINEYLEGFANATLAEIEKKVFGTVDTSKLGVMNFETVILASEIQSLSPFEPEIYDEHFNRPE